MRSEANSSCGPSALRSIRPRENRAPFLEWMASSALRERSERRWSGISESRLNTVSVMRHRLVSPRNDNALGKNPPLPFRSPRVRELIALFPITSRDPVEKKRRRALLLYGPPAVLPCCAVPAHLPQFFPVHASPRRPPLSFSPFLRGSTSEAAAAANRRSKFQDRDAPLADARTASATPRERCCGLGFPLFHRCAPRTSRISALGVEDLVDDQRYFNGFCNLFKLSCWERVARCKHCTRGGVDDVSKRVFVNRNLTIAGFRKGISLLAGNLYYTDGALIRARYRRPRTKNTRSTCEKSRYLFNGFTRNHSQFCI